MKRSRQVPVNLLSRVLLSAFKILSSDEILNALLDQGYVRLEPAGEDIDDLSEQLVMWKCLPGPTMMLGFPPMQWHIY